MTDGALEALRVIIVVEGFDPAIPGCIANEADTFTSTMMINRGATLAFNWEAA